MEVVWWRPREVCCVRFVRSLGSPHYELLCGSPYDLPELSTDELERIEGGIRLRRRLPNMEWDNPLKSLIERSGSLSDRELFSRSEVSHYFFSERNSSPPCIVPLGE